MEMANLCPDQKPSNMYLRCTVILHDSPEIDITTGEELNDI